jgi:uroporphyrinogen-III synthase
VASTSDIGTGQEARGVLVTRPGDAGQRLSAALRDRGQDALWWPAFDLLAPEDAGALQQVTATLPEFDLAIFVSPAAVRGWAQLELSRSWPSSTAIAAVGHSSLQLVRELLPGASAARLIAPGPGSSAQAGSEGLWELLQLRLPQPRRVLIVRAESGRDWLAEQLRASGSEVQFACVYRREVHLPGAGEQAVLLAWIDAGVAAVTLVTSSEAVGALDQQLVDSAGARGWLRSGLALCTHPRIAQTLRASGYARVLECEASATDVLAAIAGARAAPGGRRAAANA